MMYFDGYVRPDGTVGIRNKILIISVDECMEGIARKISESIQDSIVITNYRTCMLGGNEETLSNLINLGKNPNIAGALVLAMGCGSIDPELIAKAISETGRKTKSLVCIKSKGTIQTIKEGIKLAKEIEEYKNTFKRQKVEISSLTIGVKCGGSDASSGLAANPSVGHTVDLLVDAGATVIAGELMELVGCEQELAKRAASKEIADKILRLIKEEEKRWNIGSDTEVMSIGNSLGGLTTIEEKSLGALHKLGTRPFKGILEFNQKGHEQPTESGLYLSDTTMLCGGSAMHFAAVGAQMILWTTGGAGFNNQLIPVIRVSGNEELSNEDIDIDATGIMKGTESTESVGKRILDRALEVASGEKTNIEDIGYSYCTLYQKDVRLEHLLGFHK